MLKKEELIGKSAKFADIEWLARATLLVKASGRVNGESFAGRCRGCQSS